MIILLGTSSHLYTHRFPAGLDEYDLRTLSYERAFRKGRLPAATYIFSDLDRLGYWELELAAHLYAELRDKSQNVLNDPARFLQRFAMLRQLKDRGINSFDVWRVEDGVAPTCFPVFLRTQSGHRGPLTDLLYDTDAVRAETERLIVSGIPTRELMIVEYRAEPIDGVFRKLSIYRIGNAMVPAPSAHDPHWAAKIGKMGAASQELYDEEYEIIATTRFGPALLPVFQLAAVDYGRADFSLVGGKPEIYEINTNPMVKGPSPSHPVPIRLDSERLVERRHAEAMQAIDTPVGGKPIRLDDPVLLKQRRKSWKHWGAARRGA